MPTTSSATWVSCRPTAGQKPGWEVGGTRLPLGGPHALVQPVWHSCALLGSYWMLSLLGCQPGSSMWGLGYGSEQVPLLLGSGQTLAFSGEELIYLDPHTTQPAVEPSDGSFIPDESFHCQHPPSRMSIGELDPSIAVVRPTRCHLHFGCGQKGSVHAWPCLRAEGNCHFVTT